MKIVFFIFYFLFFVEIAFSSEVDTIKDGDSLNEISRRNIHKVLPKYGQDFETYARDIVRWNPNITNWNHPPKGQIIYIDYPYSPLVSGSTWISSLGKVETEDEFDKKFSMSVFYASSFGNYVETTSEKNLESSQNFPVTLGVAFSSAFFDNNFILGSLYWAQASSGKVRDSNSKLAIPGEIGLNLYYQYYLKENLLGIYFGYDFEKLNTFNVDQLIDNNSSIDTVDNQIHYATIGATKGFSIIDFKMNLKVSISKSVASSSVGTYSQKGIKYIFYYTYKPEGRFSFSVFYKHHSLKSEAENTSINRIGLSVGYSLF